MAELYAPTYEGYDAICVERGTENMKNYLESLKPSDSRNFKVTLKQDFPGNDRFIVHQLRYVGQLRTLCEQYGFDYYDKKDFFRFDVPHQHYINTRSCPCHVTVGCVMWVGFVLSLAAASLYAAHCISP